MRGATEIITVWNRWEDPVTGLETWHRHIVSGCYWENEAARTTDPQGAVRMTNTYLVLVEAAPEYVAPNTWDSLDEEDRTKQFTFRPGDFVGRGMLGSDGMSIADVKKAFSVVGFTVQTAIDNTQLYKRGGHYELRGV